MTYRDALAQGLVLLMQKQIPDAGIDARLLLEAVCQTDQNYLLLHGDEEITPQQEEDYQSLLQMRAGHKPLQYILGVQYFMGYTFHVNEAVLIPRQETEILVELVGQLLMPGMHILDMCTGSGCILISLLRRAKEQWGKNQKEDVLLGTGVDISAAALAVARENAQLNQVTAQFVESDLFDQVPGKFHLIVSNPPYIERDVLPTLMPEVREYEPIGALDGGESGLDFYDKIIAQAPEHLENHGILCFEIGYNQGEAVAARMMEAGFEKVQVLKDYAGLDRVVFGQLK